MNQHNFEGLLMRFRCRRSRHRRGIITVLVAVSLIAIFAVVALTVDGGLLVDARRQAKSASDAAARGAAIEMLDMETGANTDATLNTVRASAREIAASNGYANDGVNSIVTVNIPPKSGAYAGQHGYIEVVIEYKQQRAFSRLFGADPISVIGRSVAAGTLVPTQGSVIVLDPKKNNALALGKGSSRLIVDGDIFVNSRGKSPLKIDRKAQIVAENVLLAGTPDKKSFKSIEQGIRGELHTHMAAAQNPFAGLPVPEPGPSRSLSDYKTTVGGVETYNLEPGHYTQDLKFDHNDVVNMAAGTYYLDNKKFEIKDSATLAAYGVTIYNAGKKEMRFQSSGNLTLTPPVAGPYSGISVFQNPSVRGKLSFKKDADLNIQGAIYAPNSLVRFQKANADLGDDDDESAWDDLSADLDDSLSGDDVTSEGTFGANIVAGMLKIDDKSTVIVRGANLSIQRPLLGLVE
jgi:Flp pilus assembly protein TadG